MQKIIRERFFVTILISCFGAFALMQASDKDKNDSNANSELSRATETVQNITTASPDKGVPKDVLSGAKCVAVIPKLVKGAFVVGAEHGKGVATCKTDSGSWSAPAPFSITGGSWGLQIGGQAIDLVMLVMNQKGMDALLSSKFKVGASASAAAGPVGRDAAADVLAAPARRVAARAACPRHDWQLVIAGGGGR